MKANILFVIMVLLGLMMGYPAKPAAGTNVTCSPAMGTKGDQYRSSSRQYDRSDVWLYGDSITYQTWRGLGPVRGGLAVDAQWGRTTKDGLNDLATDLKHHVAPRVIVIGLGTNDRFHPAAFRKQVVRAMRLVPRSVKVVWIDIYAENGDPYAPLNKIIDATRARVVRWSKAQDSYPSSYLIDGKHVNERGCVKRDGLIKSAIS